MTIKEIAIKAGVGIGTVSRVLNNHPSVSEKTRKKILGIIERYDFKPNVLASKLARKSYAKTTIGIALPDIGHRFFFEIIREIHLDLKEKEFNLLIFNIGTRRQSVFEHISEENLAGLILLGDDPMTDEEKELIEIHNTPFLYLEHCDKNENFICFDNRHGGRLAADYLVSGNCRNIMFVGEKKNNENQTQRLDSFKNELRKNGITHVTEQYISASDKDLGYNIKKAINAHRNIDGIFFFADYMALEGLEIKKELKKNIRIIGYDDIPASGYLGLTTICQSTIKAARLASDAVIGMIENPKRKKILFQKVIKPELVDRGS